MLRFHLALATCSLCGAQRKGVGLIPWRGELRRHFGGSFLLPNRHRRRATKNAAPANRTRIRKEIISPKPQRTFTPELLLCGRFRPSLKYPKQRGDLRLRHCVQNACRNEVNAAEFSTFLARNSSIVVSESSSRPPGPARRSATVPTFFGARRLTKPSEKVPIQSQGSGVSREAGSQNSRR